MSDFVPEWSVDKSNEEVLNTIANGLKMIFNEPVESGFDTGKRLYFISVPKYDKTTFFQEPVLDDRQWNIIHHEIEVLLAEVNKKRGKVNVE
jgi:hypothetical protein